MRKTFITLSVIALAVVAGVILFADDDADVMPDDNDDVVQDQDDDQVVATPDGWETYTNPQFDFTFAYPPEGEARIEAGQAKITYLGPDNTMNSEITDGFTFFVDSVEISNDETLRSIAESDLENQPGNPEVISDIEQTTVAGRDAYTYTFESQLGTDVTRLFIGVGADSAYAVSYSVMDPSDRGYQQMVDTILQTLRPVSDGQGDPVADTEEVSIALLELEYEGEPDRGCDRVQLVSREIPETERPLEGALTELFSIDETRVDGYHNFMANTNDTLTFDRVTIEDSTANVYLSGELSGLVGVCDNPRAAIQIEETALQFATVDDVQILLNGSPTDLQPDEQGQ